MLSLSTTYWHMPVLTGDNPDEGTLDVDLLQQGLGHCVVQLYCGTPTEARPHTRP